MTVTNQKLDPIFAGQAAEILFERTDDDMDLTSFASIEVRFATSWGTLLLCKDVAAGDISASEALLKLSAGDTSLFDGHASVEWQVWGDDTTPLGDGWFKVRDVVECG